MAADGSSTKPPNDEGSCSMNFFHAPTQHIDQLPKFLEHSKPSAKKKSDGVFWISVNGPVEKSISNPPKMGNVGGLMESWMNITTTGGPIDMNSVINLAKEHNVLCGKWLFYAPTGPSIDNAWAIVARAVASGQCGHAAKVSTSEEGKRMHVVCIYTYDFSDRNYVMNVEDSLRKAGIKYDLTYKPDAFTYLGIYSGNEWNIRPTLYRSRYDDIKKASVISCHFS